MERRKVLFTLLLVVAAMTGCEQHSFVGPEFIPPKDTASINITVSFKTPIKSQPIGSSVIYCRSLMNNGGPIGITADGVGNLWTADINTGKVTKLCSLGIFHYAANGGPYDIASDGNGNVYTADIDHSSISRIDSTGKLSLYFNTGWGPVAVACDKDGNVFSANANDSSVTKRTPSGDVFTYKIYRSPREIAADKNGNVYTVNFESDTVAKITPSGNVTFLKIGRKPRTIVADNNGNVYTANLNDSSVTLINSGGVVATYKIGKSPWDVTFDDEHNVYTANWDSTITKIDLSGAISHFPSIGQTPNSIIYWKSNLWTANRCSQSVSKILLKDYGNLTPVSSRLILVNPDLVDENGYPKVKSVEASADTSLTLMIKMEDIPYFLSKNINLHFTVIASDLSGKRWICDMDLDKINFEALVITHKKKISVELVNWRSE